MTSPGPLVDARWLREHLDDPDLTVIHVSLDKARYDRGHVPGAVYSDLHRDLALIGQDPGTGDVERQYLVPDRAHLTGTLQRWGVPQHGRVVFYDDAGRSRHAARGVWLMRLHGWPKERVHLLDGGIDAWERAGGPPTREVAPRGPVVRVELGAPDSSVLVDLDQVRAWSDASARGGRVRILDVRSEAEHRGEQVQARRGGRIPGAAHLEWSEFLTVDGTFRSPGEIRARADDAAGGDASTISAAHCQGGIRAALAWFALSELAGLDVRNYAGSWEEWGNRDDTPIETG